MNDAYSHRMANRNNPSGSHARLCVFPHQLTIGLNLADKGLCASRCKALHTRMHRGTVSVFCRNPEQNSLCSALDSLLLIEADVQSPCSCTPQWAIVNHDFHIIELSNEASRFLQVSAGRFQNSIVHLARDNLRAGLRGALLDARRQCRKVIHDRLSVYRENGASRVSITVQPMPNLDECDELLMVVFQEFGAPIIDSTTHVDSMSSETIADRSLIHELEQKLSTTRNELVQTANTLEAAREELEAANEKLLITHARPVGLFTRSVIDSLYCFVGVCDTQGDVLEANRAFLESSGLASDDVIGKPFREMQWWSHLSVSQARLDEAMAQALAGHVSRFDMTVRMADERLAIIDFQMVPMRDSTGAVTHLIASAIDVTDRRNTESALAQGEEKMRGLLSEIEKIYTSAPVGLCVLDKELRFVRINKQLADMNGLPVEAHLGKTIAELLPELAATTVPALQQVLDTGEAITNISISGATPREPGVVRHWLESWLPMRNSDGEIFGVNIVVEEVTGQKRHEEQLLAMQSEAELARCAAEQANRSKSEFLANMSHEIRTPMTAILGYADLLALHMNDPENLQSVQTIKRNGQFLVDLLDDILDLSRIEAGKMTLEPRVFDPIDVVEQTRELMQVRADQQRLTLSVDYASKLPTVMHTDPTRVRQILVNLISNAIKFTENGSVILRVDYVVEPEPSVRFVVIDTGIGMDGRQRSTVLEAFTQADSSICRRFGGSGLGLTISKRLIDMLGGHLSIDSTPGAGTSVTLVLPVGPVATLVLNTPAIRKVAIPGAAQSSLRLPYRILILDDQQDVQQVVQNVLEAAGAVVIPTNNGCAALRYFSAFPEKPIDAMVLDMHMPGINGFEVTRQLRSNGAQLPIIALTADAMVGTREKCLAAGCTDYFTKPIDQAALLNCLQRHLTKSSASNGVCHSISEYERTSGQLTEKLSGESDRAIDSGSKCILVIEDHPASAHILASLLREYGHTVCCAGSAREARAQLELITPSLVLSDISLPDEDGYSLVASLRERAELAHCRFIALTGHNTLDNARGGVFEAHLIKPFDIQALLDLIDDSGTSPVLGADGTMTTIVESEVKSELDVA